MISIFSGLFVLSPILLLTILAVIVWSLESIFNLGRSGDLIYHGPNKDIRLTSKRKLNLEQFKEQIRTDPLKSLEKINLTYDAMMNKVAEETLQNVKEYCNTERTIDVQKQTRKTRRVSKRTNKTLKKRTQAKRSRNKTSKKRTRL